MSEQDIIRAWKDRNYRESLSEEQRSGVPDNPAGISELSDADMEVITGGRPAGGGGGTGQGTGKNCSKCVSSGCGYGTGCGTGGNCTKCSPCSRC